MPGYRQAARRCELCLRELEAEEQLSPYAGDLQACAGCQDKTDAAARAWNLTFNSEQVRIEKRGRYSNEGIRTNVEVRLPTDTGVRVALQAQRLFSGADQEIGDKAFDDAVRVEDLGGDENLALLADATVRTAVLEAVDAAESLTLVGPQLKLTRRESSFTLEQLERIDRAAMAVAVAVERWARGDPGSTTLRQGCRPAEPPAAPAAPQDKPERESEAPGGPPCPSCGKPMIRSLEYICRWCDLTVPRPKLTKRRRKKAIITGLIIAAAVIINVTLIVLKVVVESD